MTIEDAAHLLYEELKQSYDPTDYTTAMTSHGIANAMFNSLLIYVMGRGMVKAIKEKYDGKEYHGYRVEVKYTGRFRPC